MTVTIADIVRIMAEIAPPRLAEEWDNSGLQIGRMDWPVKNILIALDPLPNVVSAACEDKADLLITHHPLLFKPLKSIDFNTPLGSIIQKTALHKLAVFSAHTNLDSAADGVNDLLASKIGLINPGVLGNEIKSEICKLAVYVPAEYEKALLDALFETPAGKIGEYTCCSFRNKGTATFKPEKSASPFTGETGIISHAEEVRIEALVLKKDINLVIKHIRKHHPYETMSFDIFPLYKTEQGKAEGIGRVGNLNEKTELRDLAQKIKENLDIKNVKFAGRPDLMVEKAALCSGSGSSLMPRFFSSGAQVYISGDLRYHDARDAEAAGLGLIDIGHFASEHLIVEVLVQRLKTILAENEMNVNVKSFIYEEDPFIYI